MKRLEKIKGIITALEAELLVLEKMQPKISNHRNTESETRKYVRKVGKYIKGAKVLSFKLESDGTGTPPPQPRKLEEVEDDIEGMILANNSETKKGQKKQRKNRKKSK